MEEGGGGGEQWSGGYSMEKYAENLKKWFSWMLPALLSCPDADACRQEAQEFWTRVFSFLESTICLDIFSAR